MKFFKSVLAVLIFLIIYVASYIIHIKFLNVNVVFYSALIDALFAAIFSIVIICLLKYFSVIAKFEKFLLFIIFILVGYSIAITVPTVIDRSLSFYILEKIQQRGGGIKFDSFEQIFITEFVMEHRLVDIRITEQLQSGTVVLEEGCVKLTNKGNNIANFSRFFRKNLLPKKRLLMGQYSEDLTDPFKNSIESSNYKCK
jgi:hypothetical protein